MSDLHISSKDVRSELVGNKEIINKFGGDKKIIVPKTMIVGNQRDEFKRLLLFSSLDHERYDQQSIATELKYEDTMGITHEGISMEQIVGRIVGECSLLLASKFLKRFAKIVLSTDLINTMQKKNTLVAYSVGDKNFLILQGKGFLDEYSYLLKEFCVSSNLK